jgi:hydroxybutyrate-dimer hydrolase
MKRFKSLFLSSLICFSTLFLNSCDDGAAVIGGIVAVAAGTGIENALDDDDDETISSSETSSGSSSSESSSEQFEILSTQSYDGNTNDLLTAGLGQNGLTATAPAAADPDNPTASEIRTATIVNQYQILQDRRSSAGYGSAYGPAVATQFATPSNQGKVAGKEYFAYADEGRGNQNVTMMVQVPNDFDRDNPCIIAAPAPHSQGVYGAISTAGEWGLKNDCAVAYTDKGMGNGVHDLNTDTVNLFDGTRAIANDVGKKAHFKAQGTGEIDLSGYQSIYPYRIALKSAHSQQNPESNWGANVLEAIRFAFYVLNLDDETSTDETSTEDKAATTDEETESTTTDEETESTTTLKTTLTASNTLVIAASFSSGGAAALRALELDRQGLIDGVVVAAPMINPRDLNSAEGVTIKQGEQTFLYQRFRKTLFDVITYYNIYQPCASANTAMGLPGRCSALRRSGLVSGNSLTTQVADAQRQLNLYGTLATTNVIAHNYEAAFVYASLANVYANAYGKFSVVDNLCDYSYAGSEGDSSPSAKSLSDLANDYQSGNGLPHSSGTYLINNQGNEETGINFRNSVDGNTELDGYLTGALCLRQLSTGTSGTLNTGIPLTGESSARYQRVQDGILKIYASGNLRGKPTIIVHGRDDALAHVNFSSRAYYGLNKSTKSNSELVYIEVKNANHFDGLNQQYNVNTQIPLYYYFSQALDRMYDHLKNGAKLPVSQVIPTVPTASLEERLPEIGADDECEITFQDDVLTIPEC